MPARIHPAAAMAAVPRAAIHAASDSASVKPGPHRRTQIAQTIVRWSHAVFDAPVLAMMTASISPACAPCHVSAASVAHQIAPNRSAPAATATLADKPETNARTGVICGCHASRTPPVTQRSATTIASTRLADSAQRPDRRLGHLQQAPEESGRHAIAGGDPQRDERQAASSLRAFRPARAIVTVCTVVDADTPGTYIGVTCAGMARKTPGVTTFSRYQRSMRPCDNPFWKKTTRLSLKLAAVAPAPRPLFLERDTGCRPRSVRCRREADPRRAGSSSRGRRRRRDAPAARRPASPCRKTASRDRRSSCRRPPPTASK